MVAIQTEDQSPDDCKGSGSGKSHHTGPDGGHI